MFFNKVILKGVKITGTPGDTLADIHSLSASLSMNSLLRGELRIKKVLVDGGYFTYVREGTNGESNLTRIFRMHKRKDSAKTKLPNLYASEVRIKHFNFDYKDMTRADARPADPGCMDYDDISASNIDITLNRIRIKDNNISCRVNNISAEEQCGLYLKRLSGNFSLGAKETRLEDVTLEDRYSLLTADYISFGYETGKDLSDFVNKIVLGARFHESLLDFRSIGYFASLFQSSNLALIINGEARGPVCALKSDKISLRSLTEKTDIDVSVAITGLPDVEKTLFDIDILKARTYMDDAAELIAAFNGGIPSRAIYSMTDGVEYQVAAALKGRLDAFSSYGRIRSGIGNARFNVFAMNRGRKLDLKGNIKTDDLDIGKVIRNDMIGKLSVDTGFQGSVDKKEGVIMNIDSLYVSRLGLNGYEYTGINALGYYSNNKFDGRIVCHDPNLDFLFQGILTLHRRNNRIYNFYLSVPFINFDRLNLLDYKEIRSASFETMANLSIDTTDNFSGNLEVRNLEIRNERGANPLDPVFITASRGNRKYEIDLNSSYLDIGLKSDDNPLNYLPKTLDILTHNQFPEVFGRRCKDIEVKGEADIGLLTHHARPLFRAVLPDLYLADSTRIDFHVNGQDSLYTRLDSQRIGYGQNYLKDPVMTLNSSDSILNCNLSASEIFGAGISLKNSNINFHGEDQVLQFSYLFNNYSDSKNELEFTADVTFSRDSLEHLVTGIDINQSELFFQGYKWDFKPSRIVIGKDSYAFRNFFLYNQTQNLSANGRISRDSLDRLDFRLNNFDLSIFNTLFDNDIQLEGFFTGKASIMDMYGDFGLLLDLKGDNVSLFDNSVGSLNIMSKWDAYNKRFNLLLNNKYKDSNPLNIYGYYKPATQYLNINLSLKDFTLTYIEPFLSDFIEDMSGSVSGNMELSGPIDRLSLLSHNSRFNDFRFTPKYTKVNYKLNGPINFTENGVKFDHLVLEDEKRNSGTISGGISYKFFRNPVLDARLKFDELQVLNSKEKDNPQIYGSAYGSGGIHISGPFHHLKLDTEFTTTGNSEIHVPLTSASSASTSDLLSFVDHTVKEIDPYEEEFGFKDTVVTRSSNIEISAKANISSSTGLFIEINKQLGDILKCNGHGIIGLNMNTENDLLDLRGDYVVDEGSYKFVILGIASRDFLLKPGGMISFNGDIMNTHLNVEAIYKTKASISTLIADTSAVGNRRTVNCGLAMNGKMTNPNLKFSLDIPDLDPITKGRVESALSTDDKIQKQFMALIISGGFVPDQQSGIVNNSSLIYSNAGEILSNQFNNIFRQLDIPLDLGLNYQRSNEGSDLFDVALSYQAFNNRVIINGNVGNRKNSPNNWMGNFEAEVKLDKKGKMRINAFTRATDDYSNYLDNSQRNGLGFTYQDEFDNFGELMRSIFMSRRKRENLELEMLEKARQDILKEIEAAKERPSK